MHPTLGNQTVSGTLAEFNEACTDADFASLDGAEALTNKTYNGMTVTVTTGTFTLANGKTLTANKTLTFTGTDGVTITFPSTNATMARTDAGQTFAGDQYFNGSIGAGITPAATVRAHVKRICTDGGTDEYGVYSELWSGEASSASKYAVYGVAIPTASRPVGSLNGVIGSVSVTGNYDITSSYGVTGAVFASAASGTLTNAIAYRTAFANTGGQTVVGTYGYYSGNHTVGQQAYSFASPISISANTTTNVARSSGTSTVTTATAHGYAVGNSVAVSGCTDTSFNATNVVITAVTSTTFSFAQALGDVASKADTTGATRLYARWAAYMSGSAPNAFAGKTKFGSVADPAEVVDVAGNVRVSGSIITAPTRSTVASGSTIVLTTSTSHLLYDNASTAASLTVTLPSTSLTDGQTVTIATRSAITSLTVNGGTIYGAPASLAAGGFASFIYSAAGAAWFRKG